MITKKIDDMKRNYCRCASKSVGVVYGRISQRKVSSLNEPHDYQHGFLSFCFVFFFPLGLSFQ